MKRFLAAAILAVSTGLAGAAGAATILPKGATTLLVTAPLGTLGLGGVPTGPANVSLDQDSRPLFAFAITGGTADAAGNAIIKHDGSGVRLFSAANPSVSATVGNFIVDTFAGTISGIVNGTGPSVVLFNFDELTPRGIAIDVSTDLAAALTSVFGARDLTGVRFGFANTAPVVAPVPLPATAAMLLAAIVGLAVVRRRTAPAGV